MRVSSEEEVDVLRVPGVEKRAKKESMRREIKTHQSPTPAIRHMALLTAVRGGCASSPC